MKKTKLLSFLLVLGLCLTMVACGEPGNATKINLSDEEITVAGDAISTDESAAVYVANDIVSHDANGSDYTVVHITQPGTYKLSGELSAGQIAVDLGKDAKTDPTAVVTLVLDGVTISCDIAPAVVFYNAYECTPDELAEGATTVDTEGAGANIYVSNKSENFLNGGYVLDEYDAAVYSTVSMNIDGAKKGVLNVNAFTDFGDGISSEGYLVLNGGTVNAYSCGYTGNAGIDSHKGTFINGGEITATGHVYDKVTGGEQTFAVFTFIETQLGGNTFEVLNKKERTVFPAYTENDFTILLVSGKKLKEKTYSFWCEDAQFMVAPGQAGGFMGDPSLIAPEGIELEDLPESMLPQEESAIPEKPDLTKPDFGGRGDVPEFEPDVENADIVFDLVKGGNVFHVFYE